MQPEEAVFLRNYLVRQIEDEQAATRRVMAAVPEPNREYRPHATARSAVELAWHLASCEIWFLEGVIHGRFDSEQERMPAHIRTVTGVAAWYDRNIPGLIAELMRLSPERLICGASLFGRSNCPAVTYLSDLLIHSAHHRGQLSVYVRAVGGRVPAVCGGSADEPFQVAAR
jgi:uncharacterized damage-inducible protein DinB